MQPKFEVLAFDQPEKIKRPNATIRARFLKDTKFAHYGIHVHPYRVGDETYLTQEEFNDLSAKGVDRVELVKGSIPKDQKSAPVVPPKTDA